MNEKQITEAPDRNQFSTWAPTTAFPGIMYPTYGHTEEPTVIPNVNMNAIMQIIEMVIAI